MGCKLGLHYYAVAKLHPATSCLFAGSCSQLGWYATLSFSNRVLYTVSASSLDRQADRQTEEKSFTCAFINLLTAISSDIHVHVRSFIIGSEGLMTSLFGLFMPLVRPCKVQFLMTLAYRFPGWAVLRFSLSCWLCYTHGQTLLRLRHKQEKNIIKCMES